MRAKKHFVTLQQIEDSNRYYELKLDNVHYYSWLRYYVQDVILYGSYNLTQESVGSKPSSKMEIFFRLALPQLAEQTKKFIERKNYDIYTSYTEGALREINGRTINHLTWFLKEKLDYSVLENMAGMRIINKDSVRPCADTNFVIPRILMHTHSFITQSQRRLLAKPKHELQEAIKTINNGLGLNISYEEANEQVSGSVYVFQFMLRYYRRLIRHSNFKIIIASCTALTPEHSALVFAARERGIPTIEFQHGAGGYPFDMNTIDKTATGKYYADYFFTFGDYWHSWLEPPSYVKVVSVGYPLIERFREVAKNLSSESDSVIFISSLLYGSEMSKLAMRFADVIAPKGFKVIYKLHPAEKLSWKKLYPWLLKACNVEVVDTDTSVYNFLVSTKHVVGVISSVLYEAMAFGCNVYLWNNKNFNSELLSMSYLIDNKMVELFECEAELLNKIMGRGNAHGDITSSDIFYKRNSINNINTAIQNIINGSEAISNRKS